MAGTVLGLVCLLTLSTAQRAQPPKINSGFPQLKYFRDVNDGQKLDCIADGIPDVEYEWHFNGQKIQNDSRTVYVKDGKLQLLRPTINHEGRYQCFASNSHGTSMSTVIDIREATIDGYRTLPIDDSGPYDEDTHVVLSCRDHPRSVPAATYDWYKGQTEEVITGKRIVIDQDGDLHFINVKLGDELSGNMTYNCSLYNQEARARVYGSPAKLKVIQGPDSAFPRYPSVTWSTHKHNSVALIGQSITLQCIPDGTPIPTIVWSRREGSLPTGRVVIDEEKYTLTVNNVTENDGGTYVCTAVQGEQRSEKAIDLIVRSEPIWMEKLKSAIVTNGKTAHFKCVARSAVGDTDGVVVQWFRNGKPLKEGTLGKIRVSGTELTVSDVLKPDDLMNIQCNVSNSIGYQLADAFLNVILPITLKVRPNDMIAIHPFTVTSVPIVAEADPLYADRLTYRWSKDGQTVGSSSEEAVYVDAVNTLTINATGYGRGPGFLELLGNYSCLVSIGLGGEADVVVFTNITSDMAGITEEHTAVTEAGLWWVGVIVVSVAIIAVIIVIIIYLYYRNHGESYPVDERERRAGLDPEKELADSGFQDLVRGDAADEKSLKEVSLADDPPPGGDTDSLDEYGEPDFNNFNEDGSFIGNYGERKGQEVIQSTEV